MTLAKLLMRSLLYFRGTNLAVVAGVAVATAVLTGALMVGDSVRGSLRQLAVERLGRVDHVVTGPVFFRADLADRLKAKADFRVLFSDCAPAIVVRGRATNADETAGVAGVQVLAVGGDWGAAAHIAHGQTILNDTLGASLGIDRPGADVLVSLANPQTTPRDAPLAQRSSADAAVGMRVQTASLVPEDGFLGLFDLQPSQRAPRNAWVNLADLQRAVGQGKRGRANVLLVRGTPTVEGAEKLKALLQQTMTLDDYGLAVGKSKDGATARLTLRSTYLLWPVEDAAVKAGAAVGTQVNRVATHLLGKLTPVDRTGGVWDYVSATGVDSHLLWHFTAEAPPVLHYLIVTGVDTLDGGTKLGTDEVAVNAWTAAQLGLKVGDRISFTYFARQADGILRAVAPPGKLATMRVAAILPMSGMGADNSLTPEYKGFTDARSVHDWQPPEDFPFDRSLVTPADEKYWDDYHAAPKVFVNVATAQELWGQRLGGITSIRLPEAKAEEFAEALKKDLSPADVGIAALPVREQQLSAANGSTDFAQLFVSFSFFLIVAAVMLVALLFRLGIEQRARQLGLLGAIGFGPKTIFHLAMMEGAALAVVGGLIGLAGAVAYTWLMIEGLRTWWIGATATRHLDLFVAPQTLAIGLAASLIVALAAMAWSVRQVRRMPAAGLLAGTYASTTQRGRGVLWRKIVALLLGVAGIACIAAGLAGAMSAQEAFLSGGGTLLVACLLALAAMWRGRPAPDRHRVDPRTRPPEWRRAAGAAR